MALAQSSLEANGAMLLAVLYHTPLAGRSAGEDTVIAQPTIAHTGGLRRHTPIERYSYTLVVIIGANNNDDNSTTVWCHLALCRSQSSYQ